ncbi:MAG: 50S ribosomal protein L18Ae [Candidatus Micrarchaeia archaeon]
MKFFVEGVMTIAGKEKKFLKEVSAQSEKLAKEKALSMLGANHKIPRTKIKVKLVEKV